MRCMSSAIGWKGALTVLTALSFDAPAVRAQQGTWIRVPAQPVPRAPSAYVYCYPYPAAVAGGSYYAVPGYWTAPAAAHYPAPAVAPAAPAAASANSAATSTYSAFYSAPAAPAGTTPAPAASSSPAPVYYYYYYYAPPPAQPPGFNFFGRRRASNPAPANDDHPYEYKS